jgi:hypothetical protein
MQNTKPTGAATTAVARTKIGNVAYGGAGIYDCVKDGDIALTFDDGPYNFTGDLLDKLKVWLSGLSQLPSTRSGVTHLTNTDIVTVSLSITASPRPS